MRKNIVAGNWKMNNDLDESRKLVEEINSALGNDDLNCDVIIAPPYVNLNEVSLLLENSKVKLSAQNCSSEDSGAYTGEISPKMLKSVGCEYVILGHSERRAYYGEKSSILDKKVNIALKNKLTVIFCIGERLLEREKNEHFKVIESQLSETVFNLSEEDFSTIIIAYEPVWAIGTGVTASSEQAQEMHAFIRGLIEKRYGAKVAQNTSILYGGSCKPTNAEELFSNKDVDGGLIGGAALKADDFVGIIKAFK